jgi:hypothetical protein
MSGINLTKTLGLDWNLILNVAVGTVFGLLLAFFLMLVVAGLFDDLNRR